MMDIITGKTRPDQGSAFFGQNINLLHLNEAEIAQAGIGRKVPRSDGVRIPHGIENLELSMAGDKRVWQTFRARMEGSQLDRIR